MTHWHYFSIYTAAIAICRYVGTFRPFLYTAWATTRMVTSIGSFFVAYSFILPSLFIFVYHRWSPGNACGFITMCQPWAMTVISVHVYVILAAIGLVYGRILREALRLKRQINAVVTGSLGQNRDDVHQSQGSTDSSRFHENLNVMKNFAIIVGASVLIWLPQTVVAHVLSHKPLEYLQQPYIKAHVLIMSVISGLGPVVNPIVYATRFKWFKALMLYIKGSLSYRECEQSMSDVWLDLVESHLVGKLSAPKMKYMP